MHGATLPCVPGSGAQDSGITVGSPGLGTAAKLRTGAGLGPASRWQQYPEGHWGHWGQCHMPLQSCSNQDSSSFGIWCPATSCTTSLSSSPLCLAPFLLPWPQSLPRGWVPSACLWFAQGLLMARSRPARGSLSLAAHPWSLQR